MNSELKKATFRADFFGDKNFYGFTIGEKWNGWACPYFPLNQGHEIAAACREFLNQNARYDEREDKFIFESPEENEEYGAEIFSGTKLYPIGCSAWIWEQVEKH